MTPSLAVNGAQVSSRRKFMFFCRAGASKNQNTSWRGTEDCITLTMEPVSIVEQTEIRFQLDRSSYVVSHLVTQHLFLKFHSRTLWQINQTRYETNCFKSHLSWSLSERLNSLSPYEFVTKVDLDAHILESDIHLLIEVGEVCNVGYVPVEELRRVKVYPIEAGILNIESRVLGSYNKVSDQSCYCQEDENKAEDEA